MNKTQAQHPLGRLLRVTHTARARRAVFAILLMPALITITQRTYGQVTFSSAASFPAGLQPWNIVSGDFNGDGKADLAVVNKNGNNVSVLIGNGNGTFQPAVNFSVGSSPYAVATADFNHDGKLDLVTVNYDSNNVSVLLGNGNGTFQSAVNYPVGNAPVSLVATDLDRDGNVDIVVANSLGHSLSVLLGTNTGALQGAVNYAIAIVPQAVAVGDFNGDGKTDLVSANSDSTGANVSVLLGTGNGTFQSPINSSPIGSSLGSMAVGDFDRDGKLDVAIGAFDPSAKVLLGNGNGTFKAPLSFHLDNTPTRISVGDFNGDGKLDLVSVGIFRQKNVQILLGDGTGSFQSAGSFIDSVGGLGITVGDFNGDTRPDIAAVVDSQVSVVLINATPGNPENSDYFVHQHYMDFLTREPDNRGFDYWTGQIIQCGSNAACVSSRRIGTSAAFFVENEFQQSGYFVYRLYRAAFGRQPTYAEFGLDRSHVVGGVDLETNKASLVSDFSQRDQFKQSYPDSLSNTEFVNKLFDSAGLLPFTSERQAAVASLDQGGSRSSVLRTLIDIPTLSQREYNPAFVQMQYFGYLRRDIDTQGYQFWLNVLSQQPANYPRMVCAFVTSAEYQLRFSSTITRTNAECGP